MSPPGLPVVVFVHPSDEMYGADRQLLVLVQSAREICHPVVLLPADVEYEGRLSAELRAAGIETRRGPLPVLRRSYLRPSALPRWAASAVRGTWWLLRLVRRMRPAAVVTNTTAIPVGPLVSWLTGVQHIWYVRELIESPKWYAPLVRSVARLPRGTVVTNSRAVARWVGPVRGRRTVPIHNAVPASTGLVPLGSVPTAVFVGRLNDWKGWQVFAEAAGLVHASLPESRFILAGGTVPGSTMNDSVVEARLRTVDPSGAWLDWWGEVDDGRHVMQSGWVTVVPSLRPEPFGNVAIEAMAEARPVVATNMGGVAEIVVEGETGLLVGPGSAEELAAAMTAILSDRAMAERLGEAASRRHRAAFVPAVHEAGWMSVLRSTLEASSQS